MLEMVDGVEANVDAFNVEAIVVMGLVSDWSFVVDGIIEVLLANRMEVNRLVTVSPVVVVVVGMVPLTL